MKYKNMFYFRLINDIGGIESWYYYISQMFGKDYDITLLYKQGSERQIARYRENIRCIKWDGVTKYSCEKLFVNFNTEILDYVQADEVIWVAHGDYEAMVEGGLISVGEVARVVNDERVNKIIAISKTAQKGLKRLVGVDAELCYNPVVLKPSKKMIRLCSAQRMTKEKGKDRILKLIKALDEYCLRNDVAYQWDIYTNDYREMKHPCVVYRPTQMDVNRLFESYDYFVSLTDCEGYCYSVVEALMRGVPCVVTPCPVFKEIGVNRSNSVVLEFDCSNADVVVEEMFQRQFGFVEFKPKKSSLVKYLAKGEKIHEDVVLIKAVQRFRDLQEDRTLMEGEEYLTSRERADYLIEKGLVVGVN